MIKIILTVTFLFVSILVNAQQILLLDRMNGNKIVNDSTIKISSTDPLAIELTAYFTMKNNYRPYPLIKFAENGSFYGRLYY